MVTDPLPCCSRRDQTRQIGQAVLADARRGHVSPASVHLFICTLTLPSLLSPSSSVFHRAVFQR